MLVVRQEGHPTSKSQRRGFTNKMFGFGIPDHEHGKRQRVLYFMLFIINIVYYVFFLCVLLNGLKEANN